MTLIDEIPTPDQFENAALAAQPPAIEEVAALFLAELAGKRQLPATLTIEVPWHKVASVAEVRKLFELKGWTTKEKFKTVSILGTTCFQIEVGR